MKVLFSLRRFALALLVVMVLARYAVPVQLPFLMTERGFASPALSGLVMAGSGLASVLVGLAYGRIARGRTIRDLGVAAFGALAVGLAQIAAGPGATWPGFAVVGIGMGLLVPTMSRWLLSVAPPSARGRALGLMTAALFAGQFASPLVLAPVISASALSVAFFAAAAAAVCAAPTARLAGPAQARFIHATAKGSAS